jgi:hypothetical protein
MPDAPEAPPSRPRVALRATAFFTLSFVMSANGNVLPQQFFQRHTPTQKALWLASCLLLGTVTATVAVWRARRGRATRGPMLLTLGATLLAEAALFTLDHPVAYLVLNAVAVFGANTLSNLARLVGILTAPWFFTRHVAPSRTVFAAILGAGALGALAVGVTFSSIPHGEGRASDGASRVALSPRDRLLAGYALALYVSLYLLAANILYLLRDVVRLPDAEQRGGVTISLVFLSALTTNALAAWLRARQRRVDLSPASMAAPAFVLVGSAGALLAGVVHDPGPVLAGSVVLGLSYGFFLAEVREWCSRGAREEGKTALLTLFNNMTNLSSLVAFATMLLLAVAARQIGRPVFGLLLGIIGLLPAMALTALWRATRRG